MKKKALLIGINKYLHYKEKSLKGCVNDTKIMESVLKSRYGFDESNITILNDEEATRESIVRELNYILETCEPNDIIVFHFSGHGTRRRSDEPGNPDGMEETIMPYDTGHDPDLDLDIHDSDLRNWLALLAKKTANINLIFDNCYSGSVVRGERARGFETDQKEVSLPSVEVSSTQRFYKNLFPSSSANWLTLSNYYSLLTACEKTELAWEYTTIKDNKKNHYGAFTWFLVQELEKAPLNFTYQDVFEQLRIKMQGNTSLQNPQIEGNKTRQLFSDVKMDVMKYISVKERISNQIILSAGAVHGLTVDSQWGIYPSDAKHSSPENRIGNVVISKVDVVTSEGRIIEEKNSLEIKAGCRAVEEIHYHKDQKKSVFIYSSDELERAKRIIANDIEESSWLMTTDSEIEADFIVSLLESSARDKNNVKKIFENR